MPEYGSPIKTGKICGLPYCGGDLCVDPHQNIPCVFPPITPVICNKCGNKSVLPYNDSPVETPMIKKLMSVEEHDEMIRKRYEDMMKPIATGIKCPKCEGELMSSPNGSILSSFPPKKNVYCNKCGHDVNILC